MKDLKVLDRVPTYYSIGHLSVPGGPTSKPHGKYVIAYNKITKDRYLPTGPELTQSAQIYDISGEKMKLILDFPTIGEPHYAEAIPASMIMKNSQKIYKLEDNKHPYAALGDDNAKVVRKGNEIHVYMTSIRSHFTPDNIERNRQCRITDHARRNTDPGLETGESRCLSDVLYRLLFCTPPGNAGLYPGQPGRFQCTADIQYGYKSACCQTSSCNNGPC